MKFVVGWVVGGWLTPTTYIQLAGAGSIKNVEETIRIKGCFQYIT